MYQQGSGQEKIDMSSTTPGYPQPDTHVPSMPSPPGYPTSQPSTYPPPQPGGGYYPPSQPGGGAYPSFPMQQQPTSTVQNTNTTVVIQQQPAAVVVTGPRPWSSGICACFDDCGVCLIGLCSCLCCLPFIECQVSGSAGECCCVGACCPIALRTKIRTRHNIAGSIVDDCCTLACCYYCALCQMQRELNMHGI